MISSTYSNYASGNQFPTSGSSSNNSGGSSITLFGSSGGDTLSASGGTSISLYGGSGNDSVIAASGPIVVGNTDSLDLPGAPVYREKGTNVFVRFPDRTFVYGATGSVVALYARTSLGAREPAIRCRPAAAAAARPR